MILETESESGLPLEPPSLEQRQCRRACSVCLAKLKDYILPVSQLGSSKFLPNTFINTSRVDLSPLNIVKLLHDFSSADQVIYKRPRSNTAPQNKFLQSTVLQLLASGMIELKILEVE